MYLHADGQWHDTPEFEGQVEAPHPLAVEREREYRAQHPLVPGPLGSSKFNPLGPFPIAKPDREHILEDIIPQVADHVSLGFLHYGDTYKELGLPGQFADIWRKVGPLKRQMWEGVTVGQRENTREICMDLIGHCLLTIAMIDRGVEAPPRG